jgi:hypothetical protein
MTALLNLIKGQPVYTMGLIQAAIALGTSFGLNWTGEQIGAVMIFSAALLSFVLQRAVTPLSAPSLPAGSVVSVQGTQDTVEIQPTPPGPSGIEGGTP